MRCRCKILNKCLTEAKYLINTVVKCKFVIKNKVMLSEVVPFILLLAMALK